MDRKSYIDPRFVTAPLDKRNFFKQSYVSNMHYILIITIDDNDD